MNPPGSSLLPRPHVPFTARPDLIVWVFVGIVLCLLGLTIYCFHLLSAGRALIAAEATWSRAQKDAVFYLSRYAQDAEADDFKRFEQALGVMQADRAARVELTRPEPDRAKLDQFLARGGIHEQDRGPVIDLYRRAKGFGPFSYVNALWIRSDFYVDELAAIGTRLQAAGKPVPPAEAQRANILVHRINTELVPLEREFAETLGDIQRTAEALFSGGILVMAGLLLIGGISLSRRSILQSERVQGALAQSEAQLRHMVEAAPLPLFIIRQVDHRLVYANERALEQFALHPKDTPSRALSDFHVDTQAAMDLREALVRQGSVRDREVHLRGTHGREFWLLLSAEPIRFSEQDCLLIALANIDDRMRMQEDMRRKAMHDPLTGLPNRAMFMESLERALHKAKRRAVRFSVLFIDLDRFKEVNDTMGHQAGDNLLRTVADRLGTAVRQSDLVARLGGDEFVVLIEEHGGPEEVMIVAQKILVALQRPVLVDWREADISGSVGIASYPDDGTDVHMLVQNADAAMYQAKERGRNNFQFYSAELNRLSQHRFEQEKRLRGALERNEFFLEYLPEADIGTGRIRVVEALVRWRDPAGGVVAPELFMPLAEETASAGPIGTWVLDRALRDLGSWNADDVKLAVNLSPRQLQQPDFTEKLKALLEERRIDPRRLRLEITEIGLMQDSDATNKTLRELHALGTELAIDDFGTGYSSLGLVRGLPIQVVKIDRSLVSACPAKRECAAIVQASSAMSRALGIRVVAEGVETEEQRALMQQLGCDAMQGYLVSGPVDADGIAAMTRAVAAHIFFA